MNYDKIIFTKVKLKKEIFKSAFKITFIYFIVSSFWIFFTDAIVFFMFGEDKIDYNKMQTYKGILFVLISSIMIYILTYRSLNKINKLDKTLVEKLEEIDLKTRVLIKTKEDYDKTMQYLQSLESVEDIQKQVLKNMETLSDIRKALVNNEFSLVYQIIQDIEHGKVYGVEVLIRWFHPEKGYIPPLDYIPLAEKTNLIYDIEDFVVNEALEQKKKWNEMGLNIPKIGINICIKSVCNERFIDFIEESKIKYGIKKSELVIELTESGVAKSEDNLTTNLKKLRNLGIRIALDDFGTGYSSLARLKELPLDSIKIDKSFIDNIHLDTDDEIMVTGVIYFAEILGLTVVAEGIETEEQLNKLRSLGCNLGQGYFIARPISAEKIEELIGLTESTFCNLNVTLDVFYMGIIKLIVNSFKQRRN